MMSQDANSDDHKLYHGETPLKLPVLNLEDELDIRADATGWTPSEELPMLDSRHKNACAHPPRGG